MRELLPRDEIAKRLIRVFPREAFDSVLSNPLAASAVAAMLYVDAVVPDDGAVGEANWARPSLCLWMSDSVYERDSPAERSAWYRAAVGPHGRRGVAAVEAAWGLDRPERWYADNSRETLRDETFRAWLGYGAVRDRPGLATTSSAPRWALTSSFAELFDPSILDTDVDSLIEEWRSRRLTPGDRLRIATLRHREHGQHAVDVVLPDGTVRSLEPGVTSLILRGVLEQWAPARLRDPVVVTVSEPGDKVYVGDATGLGALGVVIDVANVLPDAVVVDIGQRPPTFWIIEAVATDGPVTERRRRQLLAWAESQGVPPECCRFLSAFLDRGDPAARRRLKDLAAESFAWFVSEPHFELAWYALSD